jgi:hypothetical protein
MKITFERWIMIAFVGCLVLAVAVLLADGSQSSAPWSDVKTHSPEDAWVRRMQARAHHFFDLESVYKGVYERTEAEHVFGATPGKIGTLELRFTNDVPQAFRTAFTRAVNDERTERREWTGHGKVGMLVMVDTSTRVNGVELVRLRGAWNGTYTRTIPPEPATGDRCVVVVSIPNGDPWSRLLEGRPIGPMHPLLDACAFYDAFGPPGPQINRELLDAHYAFARAYTPSPPPDTSKHPSEYRWVYGGGTHVGRCLAGSDTMCIATWMGTDDGFGDYEWQPKLGDWIGITRIRGPWRTVRYVTQLSRMAIKVGPQRFAKIWQSPKTIDAAYFDETGETLGAFIRENMAADFGAYRAGPYPPWFSTALTLFAIAATFAAALRFSPRPKIA